MKGKRHRIWGVQFSHVFSLNESRYSNIEAGWCQLQCRDRKPNDPKPITQKMRTSIAMVSFYKIIVGPARSLFLGLVVHFTAVGVLVILLEIVLGVVVFKGRVVFVLYNGGRLHAKLQFNVVFKTESRTTSHPTAFAVN